MRPGRHVSSPAVGRPANEPRRRIPAKARNRTHLLPSGNRWRKARGSSANLLRSGWSLPLTGSLTPSADALRCHNRPLRNISALSALRALSALGAAAFAAARACQPPRAAPCLPGGKPSTVQIPYLAASRVVGRGSGATKQSHPRPAALPGSAQRSPAERCIEPFPFFAPRRSATPVP